MQIINIFKHNVQKWSKILEKPLGLNTASFLQQPFVNIIHERVNNSKAVCSLPSYSVVIFKGAKRC